MLTWWCSGCSPPRGGVARRPRVIGLSSLRDQPARGAGRPHTELRHLSDRRPGARRLGRDRSRRTHHVRRHRHVVLGSRSDHRLGATFCLASPDCRTFRPSVPLAIRMVIVVAAALTLGPAIMPWQTGSANCSKPKRMARVPRGLAQGRGRHRPWPTPSWSCGGRRSSVC